MVKLKESINALTKPAILNLFLAAAIISATVFVVASFLNNKAAAKVNSEKISMRSFDIKLEAEKKYKTEFQKEDYSGTGGEKKLKELKTQVLDKMIEDEVIFQETEKWGINITQSDIDSEYNKIAQINSGEEKLKDTVLKYYGYTVEEYKYYNVGPELFRKKLEEKVLASDEINKTAIEKANDVLLQLNNGADFSETAKKYSQDQQSAQNGGDLGWIEKGKMVKEFEDVAFSLKTGEISESFKTVYGYHIIKVTEKKSDKVKVSQILFETKNFSDWLSEKIKSYNIKKYIKI